MENISAGTSIPMAILRGAQAGQLAGSEVNEREYFKVISDCQSRCEPGVRHLIDELIRIGQIETTVKDYKINWIGPFEINPRDQAATELDKNRSLILKTNWLTINMSKTFIMQSITKRYEITWGSVLRLLSFAVKNLGRRKIRTGLTVLGIVIALAFSFILLSVNAGSGEVLAGAEKLGPDIEVKARGTQVAYGMDESYAAVFEREIQGVQKASPVIMWEYWSPDKPGFMILLAMVPSDAREIYADIEVAEGRPLSDDDGFAIEIGYQAAVQYELSVGDGLEFGGENFEVVGILEKTGSIVDVMGIMPLRSLQSVLPGAEGKVSGIWIWVEEEADANTLMSTIENNYPELSATQGLAVLEYSEKFTKFAEAIRLLIIAVAISIGTLAAMNTVTITTFERTREFGTLRAIGASGGYVFKLVLVESVLLCIIGGFIGSLLGFVGSLLAENVVLTEIGMDIVAVPWSVPVTVMMIALIVGLVAGAYPALRVSKQEIVDALRYE